MSFIANQDGIACYQLRRIPAGGSHDYCRRPQPVSQRALTTASSVCLQAAAGIKFRINGSSEQAELKWNVPYIKESVCDVGFRQPGAGT